MRYNVVMEIVFNVKTYDVKDMIYHFFTVYNGIIFFSSWDIKIEDLNKYNFCQKY